LKNSSPAWHVEGKTAPTVIGRVWGIAEKSGLVPCSAKFTLVDDWAIQATAVIA
jgi:hypothetical protein